MHLLIFPCCRVRFHLVTTTIHQHLHKNFESNVQFHKHFHNIQHLHTARLPDFTIFSDFTKSLLLTIFRMSCKFTYIFITLRTYQTFSVTLQFHKQHLQTASNQFDKHFHKYTKKCTPLTLQFRTARLPATNTSTNSNTISDCHNIN